VTPSKIIDQNEQEVFSVVDEDSNTIAIVNAKGEVIGTVASPFGSAPVRSALADVTGDGIADTVIVTAFGGVPTGVVVDGSTGKTVMQFSTFEESFTLGTFAAAADINNDGFADIVLTPDQGGSGRTRILSGKDGSVLADFFGIEDDAFRGGARAAFGDVNGDGTPDLIVAAGFTGGPRIAVYDGKSLTPGGTPKKLLADFFVFEQTLRNGTFVASGDLNGDGFAEVIVGGGPGGGPHVFALSGKSLTDNEFDVVANFFAGDESNRDGVRIVVKNLDGDNKSDLVTAADAGVGGVNLYAGSSLTPQGNPTELENDFDMDLTNSIFLG